ncbi:M1 family metallopeptidase [Geodermatophilus sp. CPCC 205761]|uniref:M1 family metallopeptidase n=1 Tax=Geodermatophilus sp. CPCC 205761 TaxID=2936597 RepID=UPI003EED17C4
MTRRPAVLMATTVLVGLVPATANAEEEGGGPPSPGAPGIGDPYYPLDGNGGYDVEHYDLDLRYDPGTDVLSGTATIEAEATQALSAFNLDFVGLDVSELTVDGRPATYTRAEGELTVTPERPLREEHAFEVVVTYSGVPATIQDPLIGPSGFIHTDDGALVIGEPDVAATWFPANDHPLDAATVDVAIAVPEGLEGISNGALEDAATEDGWTTWAWEAEEPMAPYLVTLAVGEFEVSEYEADGIRFWDAIDLDTTAVPFLPPPEDPAAPPPPAPEPVSVVDQVRAALARQPEIIGFLSGVFGPYPFSTSGGIVDAVPELRFALENQTRPVYAPGFFADPVLADTVVVHELAHQWYGDSVRLAAWQHTWLNEGFATYAEWLWLEQEGVATAQEQFDAIYTGAPPEFWQVVIGDPGPGALFDIAVYFRGAMAVHTLRQVVGDTAFFQIVEEWATSRAGEAVTTDEFTALAEELAGRDLDDLFQAWLFTPERPALG